MDDAMVAITNIMVGSRAGTGGPDPPLDYHKWLHIPLEILVRTPLEKQLDPMGLKGPL